MLFTAINNLTKEQRLQLHIKGVTSSVMSMWRTGKRKPTFPQCIALSEITGIDLKKLLVEVALMYATEEERQKFAHLLQK